MVPCADAQPWSSSSTSYATSEASSLRSPPPNYTESAHCRLQTTDRKGDLCVKIAAVSAHTSVSSHIHVERHHQLDDWKCLAPEYHRRILPVLSLIHQAFEVLPKLLSYSAPFPLRKFKCQADHPAPAFKVTGKQSLQFNSSPPSYSALAAQRIAMLECRHLWHHWPFSDSQSSALVFEKRKFAQASVGCQP